MKEGNITLLGDAVDESEELPHFNVEYQTFSIVAAFLIVLIDGTILVCMCRSGCLRQATNCFLAGLALCDFLNGLVGIPLFIACSSTYNFSVCAASAIITHLISILTMLHIVLITTDRYVSIIHSMRYHDLLTKERTKKALTAVWLVAFVISPLELSWVDYSKEVTKDGHELERTATFVFYLVCSILFFVVPFVWMVYSYSRILFEIHRQCKRIKRENMPTVKNSAKNRSRRSHTVVIYILVFATYIFCWLPYHLVVLEELAKSENFKLTFQIIYILTYCRFAEAVINPLLYTFGKKDLRKAVTSDIYKLVRKLNCREERDERVDVRQDIARYLEVTHDTVCNTPRLPKAEFKVQNSTFMFVPADSPTPSHELSPSGSFK